MTEHVQLTGTDGLTLRQAEALAKAAGSTLERDSWQPDATSLTPAEARACEQALEKLLTAIDWHKTTKGNR